ncbi:MAG: outer membrane beta-barrel protein [Candidatus Eiseniibacteriota bacterium]
MRGPLACFAALLAVGLLCFGTPARAQDHSAATKSDVGLGIKGIGARLGYVDPENVSGAAVLGLHMDLGTFVRGVHLQPYMEYWSAGVNVAGVSADMSDLEFGGNVDVDFPLQGSRMTPYLGGGLGLHFLSEDSNVAGAPSGDDTKFGLNILGGVRNQVMPNVSLFGEARYSFVSDAAQLKFLGGFTYQFIY